jgi:hypothetical protein
MMDSWGNLKLPVDSHSNRRQVCTLRQEELEIEKLSVAFSDTSAKLQDLSVVLDDNTLLPEFKKHVQISGVIVSSVIATTKGKRPTLMLQLWPLIGELGLQRQIGRAS